MSYAFMVATLERILWCFWMSSYFWVIQLLTDTSLSSGDIWLLSFTVGLITWQMGPAPSHLRQR